MNKSVQRAIEMLNVRPVGKYTYGDILTPTKEVENREEAKIYFEAYVAYLAEHQANGEPGMQGYDPTAVASANIGYYSGYFDNETMSRVQDLFDVSHPVFGRSIPTAKEAFDTGVLLAPTGNEA